MNERSSERVLILTEPVPPWASPELAAAWAVRTEANGTGRCPSCGARFTMPNRHERRAAAARGKPVVHATMLHEGGCVAGDDSLRRLVAACMN